MPRETRRVIAGVAARLFRYDSLQLGRLILPAPAEDTISAGNGGIDVEVRRRSMSWMMLSSSQYVYSQNKTGSELNTNFAVLAVKNSILRAFESKKSSIHQDIVKNTMN